MDIWKKAVIRLLRQNRIAVFGASGYLGTNFIKQFHGKSEIVAIYRTKDESFGKYDDVQYKVLDDNCSIDECIDGVDAIFNFAWKKVPKREESLDIYFDSLVFSERIIKAALDKKVLNVVQVSSRCVYGSNNVLPYDEEQKRFPINLYGVSKCTLEEMSEFYNRRYGMKIKTVRLSQVYGGEKYDFGVVYTYLQNVKREQPLMVYGNEIRDYIYIKDVCNAIYLLGLNLKLKGIYNLGQGISVSCEKIANIINNSLKEKSVVIIKKEGSINQIDVRMNISKIKNELGYEMEYSIEAGLREMLEEMGME